MSRRALADDSADEIRRTHLKSPDDDTRASILIFISAHAIGSFGLAMSIFAIWFGWLLPSSAAAQTVKEEPDNKPKPRLSPKNMRRQPQISPILVPPPTPIQRASAPMHITPILTSRPEDHSANHRHVYFEDSPVSPITRRNTMPEPKQLAKYLENNALVDAAIAPLSTSPLAITTALPAQDGSEDVPADSDSSPHSSKASLLRSSTRLQKLKLFGHKANTTHRPEPLDKISDQGSIASIETNSSAEKSARRTSGGFVAAWTLSRNRTAPDVTAVESSTPSPSRLSFARRMSPSRPIQSPASVTPTTAMNNTSDILSPTFLTRKSQKRVSAPIPRTSPYGAPYFAAPPMLLDNNYQAYLKTLPQFEDEIMKTATAQTFSNDEPERGRGRTSNIRRVNLNASHGSVPAQRSASVDIVTRRDEIS